MDVRDALTKYGKTLHAALILEGVEPGGGVPIPTLCGYQSAELEPEEPGTKREWRRRVRDMRTCHRCNLAKEAAAERK